MFNAIARLSPFIDDYIFGQFCAKKSLGKTSININQYYKTLWPVILPPFTNHQIPTANLELCSNTKWNINIVNMCILLVAFILNVFLLLQQVYMCFQNTYLSSFLRWQRHHIYCPWAPCLLNVINSSYCQCFLLSNFVY